MVNTHAFITSVQNLTGEGTTRELTHFCRKWLDENGDKLSLGEADRVLAQLVSMPTPMTLGIVTVLLSKLTKVRNELELQEFLVSFNNMLPNFDVQQLHWAPDIYNRLLENLTEVLLKKHVPLWGIALMETSILIFTQGNPNWFTNLHPLLFCLCLKARYFERIEPFLQIDVVQLLKNSISSNDSANTSHQPASSSITSSAVSLLHKAVSTVSGSFGTPKSEEAKPLAQTHVMYKRCSVLLYFYYGAIIFCTLEKWEEAAIFLENAICLPLKRNSAIVLESLKKYVIISLIIGRKKPLDTLPNYRTPILNRVMLNLAAVYFRLPLLIQKAVDSKIDVVLVLQDYLEEKFAIFEKDQNVGLVRTLIDVCRENALIRLGNIFVSLQMNDVRRLAHMNDGNENNIQDIRNDRVEQMILNLRLRNKMFAQIDDSTQTVTFEEQQDSKKIDCARFDDIDEAMSDVVELARVIRAFNDVVRLNPLYIEKSIQRAKCGGGGANAMGGNGGNGGSGSNAFGSSSVFPEDEGFFLSVTGSP